MAVQRCSRRSALLLGFALSLLASCERGGGGDAIAVGTVVTDWFNAPMTEAVEAAQGESGVQLRSFDVTSGLAAKTALMSKSVDVALAAPTPLLRDPQALRAVRVLGCYMRSDGVVGIAAMGAGNPVPAPVAIVEGTISELYFTQFLKAAGKLTPGWRASYPVLAIRPPDGPPALENGSARSAVLWEPHLSRAAKVPGAQLNRKRGIYEVNVCLITTHEAYATKRAAIDRFAQMVSRASAAIVADPEAARARMEKRLRYEAGFLAAAWPLVDFSFRTDAGDLLARFRREQQNLLDAGLIAQPASEADLKRLLQG